jgi:signal transduction histidine kinase
MEKGLEINIATPWYKTWWFISLCLILVVLLISSIIREKLRQIEKLQDIRNDIAKDLHDEVGANLSNITLFLALIKQKIASDDKETKRLVDKINIFSQASQDAMSDIVWMINTKNDQFDNLSIKMKDYASSLSEDIPIKITFQIDPALNKTKMGMIQRKNIYLFFKEAFNNAIKYSNATSINIEANLSNRMIQLEIVDNGIGFEEKSIKPGNGLANMHKRATQLNGEVRIVSELGKGTSITLKCPSN